MFVKRVSLVNDLQNMGLSMSDTSSEEWNDTPSGTGVVVVRRPGISFRGGLQKRESAFREEFGQDLSESKLSLCMAFEKLAVFVFFSMAMPMLILDVFLLQWRKIELLWLHIIFFIPMFILGFIVEFCVISNPWIDLMVWNLLMFLTMAFHVVVELMSPAKSFLGNLSYFVLYALTSAPWANLRRLPLCFQDLVVDAQHMDTGSYTGLFRVMWGLQNVCFSEMAFTQVAFTAMKSFRFRALVSICVTFTDNVSDIWVSLGMMRSVDTRNAGMLAMALALIECPAAMVVMTVPRRNFKTQLFVVFLENISEIPIWFTTIFYAEKNFVTIVSLVFCPLSLFFSILHLISLKKDLQRHNQI